jgi:hypothetical protein
MYNFSKAYSRTRSDAQLIRIEATLCDRFSPVFKEAPHGSPSVLEGMA